MTDRAIQATVDAAAKWRRFASGNFYGSDALGPDHCPLCKLFRKSRGSLISCDGCPVKAKTKQNGCTGSPYEDVSRYSNSHGGFDVCKYDPEFLVLAAKEADFLDSLLVQG